MDDVEQFVIEYLQSRSLTRSTSGALNSDSKLMEAGMLDSLDLMSLVNHMEQACGFTLPDDESVPENFETPRSIAGMIKRVRAAAKCHLSHPEESSRSAELGLNCAILCIWREPAIRALQRFPLTY